MRIRVILLTVFMVLLVGCGKVESPVNESRDDYQIEIPTEEKLSESEKKVDTLLSQMKKEADTLYPDPIPYGIVDWDNNASIHEELYRFCQMLPKGGDLHIHEDKMIPISRYIQILKEHGGVSIVLEQGSNYGYLYVENAPANAVSLNDALSNGSLSESELKEILVMSEEDIPKGRWVSFRNLFSKVRGLDADNELLKKIFEEGFRSCCEGKVYLVELRLQFTDDDRKNAEVLKDIRDIYYHVKNDYPEFTVRIIGTSGKSDSYKKQYAENVLRSVIRLSRTIKDEYDSAHPEDFIIAIDLVNEEDVSKPLSEYKKFFTSDEVKESGLKLYLHAGESLRMDNDSVIDAYMYGASRVGHGFNLYRYPELMEQYREKNIAVEVCPISNYRLGYVSDIRLHPGLIYMENDVPVVICSDDGTFLTGMPLVDDYYAVILSWDLGIAEIKELCRNAILYGGLSEKRTSALLEKWEADWDEFISCIAGSTD